jgi:tRNA C32,U32 (ribose-2'-O)-methylase TrmJ
MIDVRMTTERRSERSSKDLEVMLHALQEAVTVIDDFDPDRNPARCMRQLRRLLDNTDLRIAIARLAAGMPLKTE